MSTVVLALFATACGPSAPASSPSTQSPVAATATATPARTASPTAAASASAPVIVAPSAPMAAPEDYTGLATVVSFSGDTARVTLKGTGETVSVRIADSTILMTQGSLDEQKWKTFAESKVAIGDTVALIYKGSSKAADGAYLLFSFTVPKK